jgi:hypothetical protein
VSKLKRSKWTLPGFSVLIGLIYLGAEIVGGNAQVGVAMLAVMMVFALAVLLAGRSETVRGLRGDGRDERFQMLDLRATAYAGVAVIAAVLAAYVFEIAHGRSGLQYAWLATVGGVIYLASVIYLRIRA